MTTTRNIHIGDLVLDMVDGTRGRVVGAKPFPRGQLYTVELAGGHTIFRYARWLLPFADRRAFVPQAAQEAEIMITDINEDEIVVGAKVEYIGTDDFAYGMVGFVEQITTAGCVVVEFEGRLGETFDIRPNHLRVVHVDNAVEMIFIRES
jgi:hypothetical protein